MAIGAFFLVLLILVIVLVVTGAAPVGRLTDLLMLGALFIAFFAIGIYVGAALGVLGLLADALLSVRSSEPFIGQVSWNTSTNFVFVAVPLFLLMGELMLHSGLSQQLYRALAVWTGRLPGGLLHTNIATAAFFSAVSGSSIATAATVGSVALPYFEEEQRQGRGNIRIALGSICAGGALGQLIPPSIAMIVYSLFTGASIRDLYAGGFVVGGLAALLMMTYIFINAVVTRKTVPTAPLVSWRVRLVSLVDLVPTLTLLIAVLGSIYLGWATPTEAAALGVSGALALALLYRKLSLPMLVASLRATARTTGMVGLIVIAGFALNFIIARLGLPQALATTVADLPFPAWVIMFVIVVFYLALGVFMDGFAAMITTVGVIFPVVVTLGYDPVWFGVLMVMLIEVGLISPPDGMVMYVVQAVRRDQGSVNDVFLGVLPFMGLYILLILILLIFPDVVGVLN